MAIIGIIAEYNPFHSGHSYHIRQARRQLGEGSPVVCVMSGNWVQRGDAALCDKWSRTAMAIRGGADLVLELPTLWAVSSAETFARGGVFLLHATGVVDTLSFGSETGCLPPLQTVADYLDSEAYLPALRRHLDKGISFPVARHRAVHEGCGQAAECLQNPNNNLGVEYLRAIRYTNSGITPSTLLRQGVAHDSPASSADFASASHLRQRLLSGDTSPLTPYLTLEDETVLREGGLSSLTYGTRGVFARLRAMSPEEFLLLPDSGEGLHNRLWEAVQQTSNLEDLYTLTKSRRYPHARIRRLVLWAFLGIHAEDRHDHPPYLRVLGMNRRGQALLKTMKATATLPILTKPAHVRELDREAQWTLELEARCTSLYDLCRANFNLTHGRQEFRENPVIL